MPPAGDEEDEDIVIDEDDGEARSRSGDRVCDQEPGESRPL
jgi:hypothetical protein